MAHRSRVPDPDHDHHYHNHYYYQGGDGDDRIYEHCCTDHVYSDNDGETDDAAVHLPAWSVQAQGWPVWRTPGDDHHGSDHDHHHDHDGGSRADGGPDYDWKRQQVVRR
jgi:hypothetical protein